ncbi:MAG: flagellar protein [Bacillus sp. (in: Bacteria)]|nr:flagellar protein [Bacillus sp. (in: firmicutes)]
MVTPQLRNCPKCGKLYLRIRDICDACFQKQEEEFLKVAAYLREYPGITIQELSDATDVSVSQIRQYIWAKRILVAKFSNLSYPCEMCGSMIRSGRKCPSCMDTMKQLASQIGKDQDDPNNERNKITGGYIKHYL